MAAVPVPGLARAGWAEQKNGAAAPFFVDRTHSVDALEWPRHITGEGENMKRWASALFLAALSGWSYAQSQSSFDRIKGRGQLVINYREDAAPFSYHDDKKQAVGYSIDFCRAVADKILAQPGMGKLKVAYIAVPVDRMLTYINEGSGDLLCTATSDTPARRAQVGFSRPIYIDGVAVMVRRKDGVKRLDELKGKKVSLIRATTASGIVADHLKKSSAGWKIDEVLNSDSAISQIQLGLSSAYVRDSVPLALQRALLPSPDDFVILPERLSRESIAIAYRLGDAQMQKLVDETISETIASGKAREWHDRWFVGAITVGKASVKLGLPMSEELRTAFAAKK